jgi:hypothetical protein
MLDAEVTMVTKSDIQILLEDGPEPLAQLAEWLEIELGSLVTLLNQLQIPVCSQCGRRFLARSRSRARYCSRECDQAATDFHSSPIMKSRAASDRQHTAVSAEQAARSTGRFDDVELEVVWNGIGPLPGAGGAAGLGSTLSGTPFSIGRRG